MAQNIISTITEAVTGFATGLGQTIVDVFNDIFLVTTESGTAISDFGVYTLVFLGLSLCMGVITAIVRKVG